VIEKEDAPGVRRNERGIHPTRRHEPLPLLPRPFATSLSAIVAFYDSTVCSNLYTFLRCSIFETRDVFTSAEVYGNQARRPVRRKLVSRQQLQSLRRRATFLGRYHKADVKPAASGGRPQSSRQGITFRTASACPAFPFSTQASGGLPPHALLCCVALALSPTSEDIADHATKTREAYRQPPFVP
jgi:hypothetical protein